MSGMARGETVRPVILLVVYWGKEEWNGPRNLRDMIDWEGYPEEIRNMITDYPLHLVEVRKEGVGESFKSDLREVFGFLQRAEDRERLRTYVEENREVFQHMATDACRTLEVMGNVEILNHDHEDKEDGNAPDGELGKMAHGLSAEHAFAEAAERGAEAAAAFGRLNQDQGDEKDRQNHDKCVEDRRKCRHVSIPLSFLS